jgi:hypothetical protein
MSTLPSDGNPSTERLQPSGEYLPDFDQFVTWTLNRLPPERPRENHAGRPDARLTIRAVQDTIRLVIEETRLLYEYLQKPIQQKQAELKLGLEHSGFKRLTQSEDFFDQSTVSGYLLAVHGIDLPKSIEKQREFLIAHGITIEPDTMVMIDLRTREVKNFGDIVLTEDLKTFAEDFKEKEAARKHEEYERRKDAKKNRYGET